MTTPTLLASGRMAPRKVVGSVDTSEFLVALAASAGFLIALGGEVIAWKVLLGLLVGGLVAAPVAAWLVRKVTPRLLGALVGGFIVPINARTIFGVTAEAPAVRAWVYAGIVAVWLAGVAVVVRAHRRDGAPLLEAA